MRDGAEQRSSRERKSHWRGRERRGVLVPLWPGILLAALTVGATACEPDPEPDPEPEEARLPVRELTRSAQESGTEALLQAVSPVDAQLVWASGHEGVIIRTSDGGDTWTPVSTPVSDSLQFRDVHAFSWEEAAALTAGTGPDSRLYHTGDGGITWTLSFLMDDERGFLDCLDFWDDRGVAYGDSFDGVPYILRTEDRGRSWVRLEPSALPAAPDGEGGFAASGTCARTGPDGVGWIATGAGGSARILKTADYGRTWEAADVPVVRGPAAGLTTVSFGDLDSGITLGGDLAQMDAHTDNVATTRDGGATWTIGTRPRLTGPVYGSDWAAATEVVVAVGPAGADWSRDGGASWMQLDTVDYWAVAFDPGGSSGWMTGPGGRITKLELVR